ncbi:unnamed protein product [Trichogramma brassicae]|uniref:Uncharacterized protein n=1 Tax=Trichogramma brassicae TaxID=86971 RepID=A0A6H5I5W5_9HYME|nr:unnamed protein product [Trichogramma brassicae]
MGVQHGCSRCSFLSSRSGGWNASPDSRGLPLARARRYPLHACTSRMAPIRTRGFDSAESTTLQSSPHDCTLTIESSSHTI